MAKKNAKLSKKAPKIARPRVKAVKIKKDPSPSSKHFIPSDRPELIASPSIALGVDFVPGADNQERMLDRRERQDVKQPIHKKFLKDGN